MSRYDIFNQALEAHEFINLLFKTPDEPLRKEWDRLPASQQQELIQRLMPFSVRPDDGLYPDVRSVASHYAFRLPGLTDCGLPDFLNRVLVMADDDDSADVLFLSALGALSCCLPGIHGSLFDEKVLPNLYVLITGPAASGKGKAGLARKIIEPFNETRPVIIAGNSSATAIYENLYENHGRGLIFETELDTLTQAFRMGDFSEGLRKAFHNEPITYSRRTRRERVVIPSPVLSMVLTATPNQVPKMLRSAENGLFSRFLFYRITSQKESFPLSGLGNVEVTGAMVDRYYQALGLDLLDFIQKLRAHGPIEFCLTPGQHREFMEYMNLVAKSYEGMADEAYGTPEAVDGMTSSVRRMGTIAYRMLMILSALRLIGQDSLPDTLACSDYDLRFVLQSADMLMHHTLIHYDELLTATHIVGDPDEEPDTSSPDLLNSQQRAFWEALPASFNKRDAIRTGEELGSYTRAIERYLKLYCELGILIRQGRGLYIKNDPSENNQQS